MSAGIGHFVRRFFGAFTPLRVTAADREWVADTLAADEFALWLKLGRLDALESIGVAHRAEDALAALRKDQSLALDDTTMSNDVLAAALLHDVGKLDAGFGTVRRVLATIAGTIAGRDMANAWSSSRGFTRRVGLYLRHAELGADRIRFAGGREVAAQWAAAHHDPHRWPLVWLPAQMCELLAAADGERV